MKLYKKMSGSFHVTFSFELESVHCLVFILRQDKYSNITLIERTSYKTWILQIFKKNRGLESKLVS